MKAEVVAQFLQSLGRVSAQAGVLVLLILLAQGLLGRWLTPRWRCALWLLVIVRLLLPVSLPNRISRVWNKLVCCLGVPCLAPFPQLWETMQ
jgi:beta-lactamase regulating signal transducer with metallopeptidase domain